VGQYGYGHAAQHRPVSGDAAGENRAGAAQPRIHLDHQVHRVPVRDPITPVERVYLEMAGVWYARVDSKYRPFAPETNLSQYPKTLGRVGGRPRDPQKLAEYLSIDDGPSVSLAASQ
jgi:hypothetical protein